MCFPSPPPPPSTFDPLPPSKREGLGADVQVLPDPLLVSVPPASAQLEVRDQLWRVHSALSQCRCLLERAIVREEQELGLAAAAAAGGRTDYQKQRKTVKDRLTLLLASTRELLLAAGGTAALTPTTATADCVEVGGLQWRLVIKNTSAFASVTHSHTMGFRVTSVWVAVLSSRR